MSPNRKKIGRPDSGTETLFGRDQIDFENKSNTMTIIGGKPKVKNWKPVRQEKTAEQRKNEELYGKGSTGSKKKDGSLMASAADWRNP